MSIQKQYIGYHNTPTLWNDDSIYNLKQLQLTTTNNISFRDSITENLRLGKLVERFVSFEMKQHKSLDVLAENIQIQDNKITVGEIDCILLENSIPTQVEVIYKFYLYDSTVGNTELEHWIGPNRKDSLVEKLIKLKEKQLPLLYKKATEPYLEKLHLNKTKIQQKVYFKAQLFVPIESYGKEFNVINNDCIYGFYISQNVLENYIKAKFHFPKKHDWLVDIHPNVNWLNYTETVKHLQEHYESKSPMCWLKQPNGELLKIFICFW